MKLIMQTIWKFPLSLQDEQKINIPRGAKPLAVQYQGDQLCLWALVDPEEEKVSKWVYVQGTGYPVIGFVRPYVGTVQKDGFVWHVFMDSA